ncbi:MAG: hypothetical protein Tp172MES00d2C118481931_37 [Prokaryotic dsDNA virus sp.]|nr:MAG: hypothetical protein Tp172MES00d2C118481931_37 [Prokaryotic dsDNA virus sp.]|tara:strand:- start:18609 stop:18824 length:216 start_codon:yes stop_codon:yes gene_type:complete
MYKLIVYQVFLEEVEDFIEDYFRNPGEIFRNIEIMQGDEYDEVIIKTNDYDLAEDLEFAMDSVNMLYDYLG